MILFFFFSVIFYLIGWQIYNKDFLLIFRRYGYSIGLSQIISYICALPAIAILFLEVVNFPIREFLLCISYSLFVYFISEFLWAKVDIKGEMASFLFRLCMVALLFVAQNYSSNVILTVFIVAGWYSRNTKFSVIHPNTLVIAKKFRYNPLRIQENSSEISYPTSIPDFSNAGNHLNCIDNVSKYVVTEYDIFPNTNVDCWENVQRLINDIGSKGGGIIYFPKGRYQFNKSGKKHFLQINYSNIVLEGELDENGKPLAELVNCGNLVNGERNPWLSPFFITTGERVQKSNWFFGLQFRKKKDMIMGGDRKYDPGNDCNILTPEFATRVTKDCRKGDDLIYVEDSSKVKKYIMLGMYNTDKEASLLKDILGQPRIRPEWKAASRAGEEEAPSYQWLVEVKEIIDEHTIRIVQPHWRNVEMKYDPVVYNVEILENIVIRNLKLSSTWNGLFRHHGHKLYYSVWQTLQMDYGWNGINMKRVAHGNIENVILDNFTNPLYVMDSRNISVERVVIKGHDGHQGVKFYSHACDNLFRDITFYNHYADMMGGEGNSYGNVCSDVHYLNPCFKPVKYDFHGFSEGPFSPPSYNLFENIYGFAQIHSSGALFMRPSCARTNVWWNCYQEGEEKNSFIFDQTYKSQLTLRNRLGILVRCGKDVLKK